MYDNVKHIIARHVGLPHLAETCSALCDGIVPHGLHSVDGVLIADRAQPRAVFVPMASGGACEDGLGAEVAWAALFEDCVAGATEGASSPADDSSIPAKRPLVESCPWAVMHDQAQERWKQTGLARGLRAQEELEKLGAVKHCVGVDPAEVAPADYQHGLCIFGALYVGSAW